MVDTPALTLPGGKPIVKGAQFNTEQLSALMPMLTHAGCDESNGIWPAIAQFQQKNNLTAGDIDQATVDALSKSEKKYQDTKKAQEQADEEAKQHSSVSTSLSNAKPEDALVMLLAAMLLNWLMGKDPADFGTLIDNVTSGNQNGSYHSTHNVVHYDAQHHNAKLDSAQVKSNAAELVQQFQDLGYTKEQACGIVGNIINESGCDPHAVGDHGTSFGLIQLHADRVTNYNRWADSKGYPHIQDEGTTGRQQAEFVDYELRTTELAAGEHLRQAKTAPEAARIFALEDERMRDKVVQPAQRAANAEQLMKLPTPSQTPLVSNDQTKGRNVS